MNSIENIMGEICKVILPIPEKVYYGNPASNLAICTLSSMKLLSEISESDLMKKVRIAGRLLSENKGIESLVKHANSEKIKTIILCGQEVWGHKTGHSLIALYENGIDQNDRIINSTSPDPFLELPRSEIEKFRNQVKIIDKIGETKFSNIKEIIETI